MVYYFLTTGLWAAAPFIWPNSAINGTLASIIRSFYPGCVAGLGWVCLPVANRKDLHAIHQA
jgi:hypothetical protein